MPSPLLACIGVSEVLLDSKEDLRCLVGNVGHQWDGPQPRQCVADRRPCGSLKEGAPDEIPQQHGPSALKLLLLQGCPPAFQRTDTLECVQTTNKLN